MNSKSDKIAELEQKMEELSGLLQSSANQLRLLRAELEALRGDGAEPVEEAVERKAAGKTPALSLGLESFIGLRLIHLVGIAVLVTGISIGVKYAIDKELISEGLRILLAYAAGVLLFALSVRLKGKYHLFSAILFAGSMASIYFTTYAAFVYYHFLSSLAAFLVMMALTVYTVIKAIDYNLKEIAIIGLIGAYGIPFLVSANAERIDLFFSYILLINIGVVFLSYKKSWRVIGQLAALTSWLLFCAWAVTRYEVRDQGIAILFMLVYYGLFLADAVAVPLRSGKSFTVTATWQVVLNNLALYLAAIFVLDRGAVEIGLAGVTGLLCALTAALSVLAFVLVPEETRLRRWLTWESIVLLLSFIVFQWDGVTVTLLWIVVAVTLFICGVGFRASWARLASVFLVGITLVKLLVIDSERFSTVQKISSYIVIGVLLLVGSFYYQKLGMEKSQKSKIKS